MESFKICTKGNYVFTMSLLWPNQSAVYTKYYTSYKPAYLSVKPYVLFSTINPVAITWHFLHHCQITSMTDLFSHFLGIRSWAPDKLTLQTISRVSTNIHMNWLHINTCTLIKWYDDQYSRKTKTLVGMKMNITCYHAQINMSNVFSLTVNSY